MKTLRYGTAAWRRFLSGLPRAAARRPAVERAVARIVADVRRGGDDALVRLTQRFDGVQLSPGMLWMKPAAQAALLLIPSTN